MIYPFLLAIAVQFALPVGDTPPTIDVEPVCRGIADQGGATGLSHDATKERTDCVKTEQDMRAELVKEWPTFSAADRASCLTDVSKGDRPSYTDLLTCLEMARDVRKLRSNPGQPLGSGR